MYYVYCPESGAYLANASTRRWTLNIEDAQGFDTRKEAQSNILDVALKKNQVIEVDD